MRDDLPSGTVTFLFTDVEGSTRLLHELGAAAYADALAEHRRLIREACAAHDGIEVDTQGDAFFFAFPTAPSALAGAHAFIEALSPGPIHVRVGLHTGTPLLTDEGYVGDDVHRAARIAGAGHGGQVLVSSSTATLVEFALADLGEHRFKDLAAPERVFQLGATEFPPLRTLYQTNLPVPTTRFIGRARELAEVVELLARNDVRLLTLTGVGGSGKTRLALQAAAELADGYEDGVWWVPLAALLDPELVLDQAGQALGATESLQSAIAGKRLLLVLDNFEQVVAAGPQVAELVRSLPELNILVTSREPLHVTPEQEYAVLPLEESEAIDLFHARARAVVPDFGAEEVVAEICDRLDHLPLAVELAAARVRALPPEQMLTHLEQRLPFLVGGPHDVPERQRTLRATIAWSYELLSSEEQAGFGRLGVFAGGCTLEAARRVDAADLDLLQSLVEKSLLRHADARYFMLETVREYALERLEEIGESTSVGDRHARYYAGLVDCRWTELVIGATEFRGLVASERRNLSAALEWSLVRKNGEDALAIVSGVWPSWADSHQGRRLAERALALPAERLSQRRGDAQLALSQFAKYLGDLDVARHALEESLAAYREVDEHSPRVAASFTALAEVALAEGDLAEARRLAEEGVRIRREQLDSYRLTRALSTLVEIELADGDLERARELAEETLERCRVDAAGSPHDAMVAQALRALAEVAVRRRDFDTARRHLLEAFDVMSEIRPFGLHITYELIGSAALVAVELGDVDVAAVLAGAVDRRADGLGIRLPTEYDGRMPLLRRYADSLRRLREEGEAACFDRLYADGRLLEPDKAIEYAVRFLD